MAVVCDPSPPPPAPSLQELFRREKDPDTKVVLRHLQYEHRVFQMSERQQYYSRRLLAQQQPHLYTSIIIDGMTQATTAIPTKARFSFETRKLEQKLIGVLCHKAEE